MEAQAIRQRRGTLDDAAFLARMYHEASIPPFEASFWDQFVAPTGSDTLTFLEQMFRHNASNWGNAEDFLILEVDGKPVACCCVFRPLKSPPSEGSFNLDKLDTIASALGWSAEAKGKFRAAYSVIYGGDTRFLEHQADVIVEVVGVVPEFRGHGLGDALMKAAFERGRQMGAASIGVMVINGNDTAQALYEKHFERFVTFHGAYFDHYFPGLTKYRAKL